MEAPPDDAGVHDAARDGSSSSDGSSGDPCDSDGDGFQAIACGGNDCDDSDRLRSPGGREVCDPDGRDEDCVPTTYGFRDVDNDGYVDRACCNTDGVGTRVCGDDCNDMRAVSHPDNTEACDRFDNDCDSAIDEGVEVPLYPDADDDTHGDASAAAVLACADTAGLVPNNGDCNDGVPSIHPAAREICNGADDDCNEVTDDGDALLLCSLPQVATHGCNGQCTIVSCVPGWRDCDTNAATGCEIDLTSDENNCGACNASCVVANASARECIDSACTPLQCFPSYHECDGRCASNSSPLSCGSSCTPCPAPLTDGIATCINAETCGMACSSTSFRLVDAGTPDADCEWNDPSLVSLVPSTGVLVPSFTSTRTEYVMYLPSTDASLSLTPTAAANATVSILVGSEAVASGSTSSAIALPLGDSTIAVQVQPEYAGATPRTYNVRVTRGLRPDAYVKASNTDSGDCFGGGRFDESGERGRQVAIDGDTLVVGAPFEASNARVINGDQTNNDAPRAGAVYVFVRSGGTWVQQAYLKASNADAGDEFGNSVAIEGDTIVVGAAREDGTSASATYDSGAAYVFTRSGTSWAQTAYIRASAPGEVHRFGGSVAISGQTILVGSSYYVRPGNSTTSGAAYVFTWTGTVWDEQALLLASNGEEVDEFGFSVDLDGNTAVVGAWSEDSNLAGVHTSFSDNDFAGDSGAAYVFVRNGTSWTQQAYLKASNTDGQDRFGWSVAVSGDTIIVGAPAEDSAASGINGTESNEEANESGAAYVFLRSGTAWSQQAYVKASNTGSVDYFGWSVSALADMIVVGAIGESSSAAGQPELDGSDFSGAAYAFVRSGPQWSQRYYIKATNVDPSDLFGHAVALSSSAIVVGASRERSSARGVGGDQTDNSFTRAGAAYVYSLQ